MLQENHFNGTLPVELGSLIELELASLQFYSNLLTGNVPTEIGGVIDLIILEVYENQFSGALCTELGSLTIHIDRPCVTQKIY